MIAGASAVVRSAHGADPRRRRTGDRYRAHPVHEEIRQLVQRRSRVKVGAAQELADDRTAGVRVDKGEELAPKLVDQLVEFRTRRDESTRFAPGEIDADSAVELVVRYPIEAPAPVKGIPIL